MKLTRIRTAKKQGFASRPLHKRKKKAMHPLRAIRFLKQKSSFLMASLSLLAFLAGNMVGEHGWHTFWASVLGDSGEQYIDYTGTVAPIASVPDYARWSMYGGTSVQHTYAQVPADLLLPLPRYDQETQSKGYDAQPAGDVYSVGHMGSYADGADGHGSHVGVDIRVPQGTPVLAIANGIVTDVRNDAGGFGLFIVIKHPRMPDVDNPGEVIALHSVYAHLSAQDVAKGDIVKKGQVIGKSGQTGFATGPHLHFSLEKDSAPYHPYWAFSSGEAREAGLTFTQAIDAGLHQERGYEHTLSPLVYIQRAAGITALASAGKPTAAKPARTAGQTPAQRLASRRDQRIAKRGTTVAAAPSSPIVHTQTVASADTPVLAATATVEDAHPAAPDVRCADVASVQFQAPKSFSAREWMKGSFLLLDAEGKAVPGSCLRRDLAVRTAYGEAEFRPSVIRASDFAAGSAAFDFEFLPLGRRTVVLQLQPFGFAGKPIEYKAQ